MKKYPLVALKDFEYSGCTIKSGDRIDATAVEAAAFTNKRRARFATASDVATVSGPVQARDMRPEPPAELPEPEPPVEKPRAKRRYRRRDMAAEE